MVKAVIFDCFGVLTADSWHEFRIGLNKDLQTQASELNHQYCAAKISRQEFLSSVASLTKLPEAKIASVIDNENDKNYDLLSYIAELKGRGLKIGLLSNVASNWIRTVLLSEEEQKLFDAFVFSYEVGMIKPDPRMYQLAAQRLSVDPNTCVFVDDIDRLAYAASNVGMQSIVYRDFIQMKSELEQILEPTLK